MKGDFTRLTFQREKHYHGVQMQQGRVQVDADWNEQLDIAAHRVETETRDVIGPCGLPIHEPDSFKLVPAANDIEIARGRIYVDGILCENDQPASFKQQPDLPVSPLPTEQGVYVAYLDVWLRHLTALDDRAIREVALGGPDTATRTKTVWQAKLLRAGDLGADIHCLNNPPAWTSLVTPPTGQLSARTAPGEPDTRPCIIPASAGYRRLENQLYRVEIHQGGVLGDATFKWSRDNGTVVTTWEAQGPGKDELTVGSAGRDRVLSFVPGQWIELTDDTREQQGTPGTLVQLLKVDGNTLTIDPATAGGTIDRGDFPANPKVRRWDQAGAVADVKNGIKIHTAWTALEDGVEVKFSAGSYRTGDYWLIPARTGLPNEPAAGDVEWPKIPGTQNPAPQPPHGIQHHYCRLGVLTLDGTGWRVAHDCRQPFPPATELISLFYLSGDGQEATVDPAQPGKPVPLPQPLMVGVSNGRWPVNGATVLFKITMGGGVLKNGATTGPEIRIKTGTSGVSGAAQCAWELGPIVPIQQVEATLLDDAGLPVHLPVRFNASLEQPDTGGCCSITVGKDGEFETLDEALRAAAQQQRTNLCICLLPGDHKVSDLQNPAPLANLTIAGCGESCRLVLGPQSGWTFKGLNSFTLRDVEIAANGIADPIQFLECGEFVFESCRVIHSNSKVPTLTLRNIGHLRLTNNTIETYSPDQRVPPVEVLKDVAGLDEPLKALDLASFNKVVARTVTEIASKEVATRKKFGALVKRSIDRLGQKLGPEETDVYAKFLDSLTPEVAEPSVLVRFVTHIWKIFRFPTLGVSLVIEGNGGLVTLQGNVIFGIVSFDGPPATKTIDDFLQRLARLVAEFPSIFTSASGTLQVHQNLFVQLTVSERMVTNLRDLVTGDAKTIEGIYESSFFTDNLLRAGRNLIVGRNHLFSSNSFTYLGKKGAPGADPAGTSIAESAVFMGNHAPIALGFQTELLSVARVSKPNDKTLTNLTIVITDV